MAAVVKLLRLPTTTTPAADGRTQAWNSSKQYSQRKRFRWVLTLVAPGPPPARAAVTCTSHVVTGGVIEAVTDLTAAIPIGTGRTLWIESHYSQYWLKSSTDVLLCCRHHVKYCTSVTHFVHSDVPWSRCDSYTVQKHDRSQLHSCTGNSGSSPSHTNPKGNLQEAWVSTKHTSPSPSLWNKSNASRKWSQKQDHVLHLWEPSQIDILEHIWCLEGRTHWEGTVPHQARVLGLRLWS